MLVHQRQKDVVGEHGAEADELGIERAHDGRQDTRHQQSGEQRIIDQHLHHGAKYGVGVLQAGERLIQVRGQAVVERGRMQSGCPNTDENTG